LSFEAWQLALLAATGVAAGILNVMAGGGSLLSVPVMLFLGLPGPVANGTNRISIIAQNIVAVRTFCGAASRTSASASASAACACPVPCSAPWSVSPGGGMVRPGAGAGHDRGARRSCTSTAGKRRARRRPPDPTDA
jgi:hypothetical protein